MDMYYLPELWSTMNEAALAADPFAHVAAAAAQHLEDHGCDAYPSTIDAPLVATYARAIGARRILELGCGLGYSALWLAHGGGPQARVQTIERVAEHRDLAAKTFRVAGMADRVEILAGDGAAILAELKGPYDLIYADGDIGEYSLDLPHFERLLRVGGVLASANLFLDELHPEMKGARTLKDYRQSLLTDPHWFTTLVPLTVGLAISVRQEPERTQTDKG